MRIAMFVPLLLSFALVACARPATSTGGEVLTSGDAATATPARSAPAPADVPQKSSRPDTPVSSPNPNPTGIPGRTKPAPPMSAPLPPERAPDQAVAPKLDTSCRTSSDCAVKNVGSCCGAMPACVNKGARPDPAAVQAQCAKQGMSSICGFKEVTGCSCIAGTCQDKAGAIAQ